MSSLFILNPTSGNNTGEKVLSKLEVMLKESEIDWDIVTTDYSEHAISLAEQGVKDNFKKIIAVGGDGTLHHVVNGVILADQEDIKVGILSIGNGNDYIRAIPVPTELDEALEVFKEGHSVSVPTGKIDFLDEGESRSYINNSTFGISAYIAHASYTKAKWLKGRKKYIWLALKEIRKWKNVDVKMTFDGEEREVNLVLSSVGLGQATGAGLNIFPDETPIDKEEFSVLIARDLGKFQMIRLLSKLPKGKHVGHSKVDFLKAKTIEFSSEDKMPVEADGEVVGFSPHRITFVPDSIQFMIPNVSEEIE
ncbi:MAG: diacylglycerol kinase family lipid kinase [Candidatus Heimdallarchaeota archaeon]|nr:diacylglycerol kinase family lipid kinase [Candidatus Heimdallarchaeota archaeon]MCK5049309.1 diacylglycerol kinase family lipid kinase [Candidatus Heimdallarchaeota archaeon]